MPANNGVCIPGFYCLLRNHMEMSKGCFGLLALEVSSPLEVGAVARDSSTGIYGHLITFGESVMVLFYLTPLVPRLTHST